MMPVALRKESVDRNSEINTRGNEKMKSLSARRAWIEIYKNLPKQSIHHKSLSARRAWIEIVTRYKPTPKPVMSLSARRAWIEILFDIS